MNSDELNNTSASGTTSVSEPRNTGKAAKPDYLQQQADDARAAMAQVATEMKSHLVHALDPRTLTRDHPWIATGTVAATGFFIARSLTSSRHWSRKREREEQPKQEKSKSSSLWSKLVGQVMGMVQPAVVSAIGSAVSNQVNSHHEGNGHAEETTDPASTI